MTKIAPRFKDTETPLPATQFSYDILNRRTVIAYPDGLRSTVLDYSTPGQVTRTDENGHAKHKFLDAYGRVEEIHEINGSDTYTTLYTYDATGSLTQVKQLGTGNLNIVTTMTYDPLGRKAEIIDPNMGQIDYTYDNAGNLLTQVDPNLRVLSQSLTFEYDLLGRKTKKSYPGGSHINWTYDISDLPDTNFPIGRLTTVIDLAAQARFVYDQMGRIVTTKRTIDGTPYVLTQQYNALSKVTSQTFPGSAPVTYIYDEAGSLSGIPGYIDGPICNPGGGVLAHCIKYNARGQTDEIDYNNGVVSSFDYFDQNVAGQFINFALQSRVTLGPGQTSLQNLSYTYDKGNNVKSITDTVNSGTRDLLIYDDLNRLTEASGKFGTNQSQTDCTYIYDPLGNILNKCGVTYSYNDANHPSFVTSTSDGRTYTADANGNTKTGAGRTFSWTADNFPSSIGNGSGTTAMNYDYSEVRVKKNGPLGAIVYPFPGFEIEADGTKTTYFTAGTEILASRQVSTSSSKKFFYHNDNLGGINVVTDESGNRAQLTEYDPWGKISRNEPSNNSIDPSRRFTGQIFDVEIDLYYYGARYYDPDLARFVSPDSDIPDPGRPKMLNRYSYGFNNPTEVTDPTGHEGEGGDGPGEVVETGFSELPGWTFSPKVEGTDTQGNASSLTDSLPKISLDWSHWGNVAWGAAKFLGGIGEAAGGVAFGIWTAPSIAGGIVGGAVAAHGVDVAHAGWNQMTSGTSQSTLFSQGLQSMGLSQPKADLLDASFSLIDTFGINYYASMAAAENTLTVTHFTDLTGVKGILQSGYVRADSYVTLPGEVNGLTSSEVESALEINAGRGAFSTQLNVRPFQPRIPDEGPLTSGGRIQLQLTEPVTLQGPFTPTPK